MVSDLTVAERARCGACMAFVMIADTSDAVQAAGAMWQWWARVPVSLDAGGWGFVPVKWMFDRE